MRAQIQAITVAFPPDQTLRRYGNRESRARPDRSRDPRARSGSQTFPAVLAGSPGSVSDPSPSQRDHARGSQLNRPNSRPSSVLGPATSPLSITAARWVGSHQAESNGPAIMVQSPALAVLAPVSFHNSSVLKRKAYLSSVEPDHGDSAAGDGSLRSKSPAPRPSCDEMFAFQHRDRVGPDCRDGVSVDRGGVAFDRGEMIAEIDSGERRFGRRI